MNKKSQTLKESRTDSEKRKFRGKLGKRNFSVKTADPNFEHRWVITTYENDADPYERVEKFIDSGWSVVYDDSRPEDERSSAPDNDTTNSERMKPVTKRLRGGHTAVLMKCSREQRAKNELNKAKRDEERRQSMVKRSKKAGSHITSDLEDVDLNASEEADNQVE